MPGRPPKEWWDDCVSGVESHGGAYDPARVCGAVWARKTPSQKRVATKTHEGGSRRKKMARSRNGNGHRHSPGADIKGSADRIAKATLQRVNCRTCKGKGCIRCKEMRGR